MEQIVQDTNLDLDTNQHQMCHQPRMFHHRPHMYHHHQAQDQFQEAVQERYMVVVQITKHPKEMRQEVIVRVFNLERNNLES